jgi:hypothetical protein
MTKKKATIYQITLEEESTTRMCQFSVHIHATENVIYDPAIPKEMAIDVLTEDFKSALLQFFKITVPLDDVPPYQATTEICAHCHEPIKDKADITAIVHTDEQKTSSSLRVRRFNTDLGKFEYTKNITVFHRDCFKSVAGSEYEYRWRGEKNG